MTPSTTPSPDCTTTAQPSNPSPAQKPDRIAWVDYAKGLSILLVVQLHSSLGLSQKIGFESWGDWLATFCVTFRMPLFFLVAGLFLARSIDKNWRTYLDGKVLHFAYFYVLWMTIKFIVKAPQISNGDPMTWVSQYAFAYVQPYSVYWFIYLLAIFFIVTRLLRFVPLPVLWFAAAGLHMAHIETGSVVVDQFASRYVFFLTGYMMSASIFSIADLVAPRPHWGLAAVLVFALLNGLAIMSGLLAAPGMTLALGLFGAVSVIAVLATCAAHGKLKFLGYCGARSLPIYLAFFLPMAVTRIAGMKVLGTSPVAADILGLAIPLAGVLGALAIYWTAERFGARFLFNRPAWARLSPARSNMASDRVVGAAQG